MLRYILTALLFFSTLSLNGQSTDSLKWAAKGLNGEKKFDYYSLIGIRSYYKAEFDSAFKYFELAVATAKRNGLFEKAGGAMNNVGAIKYERGDYLGAIFSYQSAIELFRESKNDSLLALSLTNLGKTFKRKNVYDKALEYLYESAEVLVKRKDKKSLATCYSTIGNIHKELGASELSLDYQNKSLLLSEEIDDKIGISQAYQNIGIWYLEEEGLQEAKDYLFKALDIKENYVNERSKASTMAKIGELYVKKDSLDKALFYFENSLDIRKKYKDALGIVTSSNHLAKIHMGLGNPNTALKYLKTAMTFVERGSYLQEEAISWALLGKYYRKSGDFQLALEASDQLSAINQLIFSDAMAKSTSESEIKFEVFQKDQKISFQKSEVDSLNKTKRQLTIIVSALVILVIVSGILYRQTRKLSKERKRGKERVERLLKELNHRTKNHLQAQSGLIKRQLIKLKDHPAKELIRDIDNQIKAINLIHTSLYVSTEESPESINLTTYIENLVENLMISFGTNRNQIDLKLKLQKVDIDVHKALPIGLILNESITNTFKYAFNESTKKALEVELMIDEAKMISLIVCDNGPGFDLASIEGQSSGIGIMKSLAEDLSGRIEIFTDQGTVVKTTFCRKERAAHK